MSKKLVFLLPIFFVFFKFGKSAEVMMSISGDKGFLFHTKALEINETVGFIYNDNDGGFVSTTTCTENSGDATYMLNTNCTVAAKAALSVTAKTKESEKTLSDFPVADTATYMMVASPATTSIAWVTTSTAANADSGATITVTAAPTVADSTFLCNNLGATDSKARFAVTAASTTSSIQQLMAGSAYQSITKCLAVGRSSADVIVGIGTYVMIIKDHTDITDRFYLLAIPSTVVLQPSIDYAINVGTAVGYIDGNTACPTTNSNLTFPTTAGACKGKIIIKEQLGNNSFISFSYNGTNYHLPVTGVNTTCGFAFNVRYSNIFVGMLLISLLNMLNCQ